MRAHARVVATACQYPHASPACSASAAPPGPGSRQRSPWPGLCTTMRRKGWRKGMARRVTTTGVSSMPSRADRGPRAAMPSLNRKFSPAGAGQASRVVSCIHVCISRWCEDMPGCCVAHAAPRGRLQPQPGPANRAPCPPRLNYTHPPSAREHSFRPSKPHTMIHQSIPRFLSHPP